MSSGQVRKEASMYDTAVAWVVVLEAADRISESSLQRLLHILSDVEAVALHCPERYAVQVKVCAGGHAQALFVAAARWHSALAVVGQPRRYVVRAEVLSLEEFERECRRAYGDGTGQAEKATEECERHLRVLGHPRPRPNS